MKITVIASICMLASCAATDRNCSIEYSSPTNPDYLSEYATARDRQSSIDLAHHKLSNRIFSDVVTVTTLSNSSQTQEYTREVSISSNVRLFNVIQHTSEINGCWLTTLSVNKNDIHSIIDEKWRSDREEIIAWRKIEFSNDLAAYKNHLVSFPAGIFYLDAKKKIENIEGSNTANGIIAVSAALASLLLGVK